MRILTYFIALYIETFFKGKRDSDKDTGVWGVLTILNVYIYIFIFLPLVDIFKLKQYFELIVNFELIIFFAIAIYVIELFYFFWDTRWLKLYEEVKEWPKQKIIKQRNILLTLFIVITSLSIIYQYYNFSFGRW